MMSEEHTEVEHDSNAKPSVDIAAEIATWWAEEIHGSVIARNAEALNHLRAALERLKTRLGA